MSDEKQKRDEISSAKNEDRILSRDDALQEETTLQFTAPPDKDAPTKIKSAPEIAPTEILSDAEAEPTEILTETEAKVADENALRPSSLRLALVCLLFVFAAVSNIVNLVQIFAITSSKPEWTTEWKEKRFIVTTVDPNFADRIKVGDELVSVNNESLNYSNHLIAISRIKSGERYILQLRRGTESSEVELVAQPLPFARVLFQYIVGIFLPAAFFLTALAVFLLKPNDKQALLTAVLFVLLSSIIQPSEIIELPLFFTFWWLAFGVISTIFPSLLLHLFLVFPKRSPLVRRFPNLEWLIYLPVLPSVVKFGFEQLSREGWTQFDFIFQLNALDKIDLFVFALYLFAALAMLILNYLKTNKTDKRRIRLVVAGFTFALAPALLALGAFYPLYLLFNVDLRASLGEWGAIILLTPLVLMPLSFAYAIVRHKVIPVSFVVRRGLQYLLAKNALRLLLILPILGIVWNVAANPNRTLSEILLNNSFAFYLFIALAVGFFLLMRSRFSDLIDRRFFREQYNQEKLLRELIDDVKQSDSMPKMSRLVSSRIQSAIHPQSVYLFYEDLRQGDSDFSTGYTTSEDSDNLKLAVDSPLLRFIQKQRGAIDFPFAGDNDLPLRETAQLRSIGANLLVPMHGTDGKLAGFFSLGEKMSEIPYTSRDKELLESLANQIALVNENLSLKDRVRREQRIKTEVLSRFDEADINLLKECPTCGKCNDRTAKICDLDGAELTFTLPVERTVENRYRLEKLLGKGGMGAVYQATDLRINRAVAVKILSGAMFGNKDALRRFEREAQTAGKLNHRNIVTVFDYGILSTEGAFLVMELVKGETLSEILRRTGKLDADTVVAWFGQVLDGVEAAHKAGIVHRDLKPDNIFVTRNEDETVRLCILDFGLARFSEHEFAASVTVPGTIMGTLGYMPPEQLRGEKASERSDLFAAGVIIYEALRGEKPFAGKTYQEIIRSMSEEFISPQNNFFTEFFRQSLAQNAEGRFASASEMKRNLLAAKIK